MTNEEAIAILEEEAEYLYQDDESYNREAFRMAIQALSQEPCDDAISREAVMGLVAREHSEWDDLYIDIAKLPSVTPSRHKGRWLMTGEVDVYYDLPSYECSKCGRTSLENGDFCPNCGARMIEPQESEDKEC